MKRFLSIVMLMAVVNMQAAPLAKMEQAIVDTDLATFKQLLQDNTLTETEAQFLLSRAEFAVHINEKVYFTCIQINFQTSQFLIGAGFAFILASSFSLNESLPLSAIGLVSTGSALYYRHSWKKETEPKLYKAYANSCAIQRLMYMSLLNITHAAQPA